MIQTTFVMLNKKFSRQSRNGLIQKMYTFITGKTSRSPKSSNNIGKYKMCYSIGRTILDRSNFLAFG